MRNKLIKLEQKYRSRKVCKSAASALVASDLGISVRQFYRIMQTGMATKTQKILIEKLLKQKKNNLVGAGPHTD